MRRSPLSPLLLSTHLRSNSTTCIPIIQSSTQTSSSLYARPPIPRLLFFPSQVNSAARRSQFWASALPGDAWSHEHKHLCCIVFSTKVTQGNNKAFSMLRCIPTLRVKQTCSSLSHHNPNPPTLLNPLSSDISNYDCPVLLIKQIYFNCI